MDLVQIQQLHLHCTCQVRTSARASETQGGKTEWERNLLPPFLASSSPVLGNHNWNLNAQEDQLLYGKTGWSRCINSKIFSVISSCVSQVLPNEKADMLLLTVFLLTFKQRVVKQGNTWTQRHLLKANICSVSVHILSNFTLPHLFNFMFSKTKKGQ